MPVRDIYHESVKNALTKDGWEITDDPYFIRYKEFKLFADLAAESILAAEQENRKIVVEIKSFLGASFVRDLENALGQYILYRNFLNLVDPQRWLYLAISFEVYKREFIKEATQVVIKSNQINLLVVDTEQEVISQWID